MKLQLYDIKKSYGNVKALNDINLEIDNGLYGLLGENGAGKSTLFKIISGELTNFSGEIIINDKKIDRNILSIGYLPQKFEGYDDFRIKEFLDYIGQLKMNKHNLNIKKEIEEKLEFFSLNNIKNKKMGTLSGGQKRRVGLAQAFLMEPDLVLLDEPTAGLDPKERIRFKNYIYEQRHKRLIIISTHLVTDIETITERVFILKAGEIVMEGREEDLKDICKDYVWEIQVNNKEDFEKISLSYTISSTSEQLGNYVIRVISNEQPSYPTKKVIPSLDEVYLSNFRGGTK